MSHVRYLRNIPFFASLSAARLRDVDQIAREIGVPSGEPVFSKREAADAMFIVLSGRIKICTESAGRKRKIFAYLTEGDFFGEMALLEDLPRTATAQAVENSRLLVIGKAAFSRLLRQDRALALYLLRTLCTRLRLANAEIEGMIFSNILGRAAKAMLGLAQRSGERWNDKGLALTQRFTQQELADLVGTTREPLTRALSSLRRAGLLTTTEDGRYAIPEPEKLAGLFSN